LREHKWNFTKCRAPRKINIEQHPKNIFCLDFEHEASEVLRLPREIIIMYQKQQ